MNQRKQYHIGNLAAHGPAAYFRSSSRIKETGTWAKTHKEPALIGPGKNQISLTGSKAQRQNALRLRKKMQGAFNKRRKPLHGDSQANLH